MKITKMAHTARTMVAVTLSATGHAEITVTRDGERIATLDIRSEYDTDEGSPPVGGASWPNAVKPSVRTSQKETNS